MDVERVSPALYERRGAHASADLAVLLDSARREWGNGVTASIVDRFERRLTEEIAGVRAEVAGLRTEMHAGRTDIIKWMFVFWVTQMMAIGGLVAAMLRQVA